MRPQAALRVGQRDKRGIEPGTRTTTLRGAPRRAGGLPAVAPRAACRPRAPAWSADGRRRTPGLRREEVAQLAGVGLSWYTWLEQGRDIKPSAQVLDALARVLRLDAGERAHLFHLARVELPLPAGDYPHEAPPELAALVAALAPDPAYLIGPRTDVLAWNAAPSAARRPRPPRPTDVPQPPMVAVHARPRRPSGARPRATRSRASAPSTRAGSATRTSRRSSSSSTRPATRSAPCGRGTRCSPSSSVRRRSSTRELGRLALAPPAGGADQPSRPAPDELRAGRRRDPRRARDAALGEFRGARHARRPPLRPRTTKPRICGAS